MRWFGLGVVCVVAVLISNAPANAVIVEFTAAAMRGPVGPIGGSAKGQTLENQINSLILAPQGLGSIEFGATDGGSSAVDSMAFEGSATFGGLTVITGFGFIYRFNSTVSDVRVRFSNVKDDDNRWLHAFNQDVSYVRQDPGVADNQHILGNPINFPDLNLAIASDTGMLPSGNEGFLDLNVSGNISAIVVRSDRFLWNLREIEFNTAAVPAPDVLAIFAVGLAGLGFTRRKRAA